MKARDGKTDIYGLMYTPTKLDSTKKYPIINHIYPGPQSGSVGTAQLLPRARRQPGARRARLRRRAIDGMGTPGRSKAFHDAYYGHMGDNTLPDQVAGMKELAQRYRFIDIDKVGHLGTLRRRLRDRRRRCSGIPDFFKVGISESGNHDNRNYEDDWGERYQGLLAKTRQQRQLRRRGEPDARQESQGQAVARARRRWTTTCRRTTRTLVVGRADQGEEGLRSAHASRTRATATARTATT